MLYAYTAKNQKGDIYSGEAEAENKIALYSKVRNEGGKILTVRENRYSNITKPLVSIFSRVSFHDKIIFAKNLSSMLGAGLSMTRALEVMGKQARKKSIEKLVKGLSEEVSKGLSFSEALSKRSDVFPSIFISMAMAGEESGNLSDALATIASQMDKSYTLNKRIRGAMIYPAVILSLMVVISILLLVYMVPTLTATFEGLGVELPLTTRMIITASDFMVHNTAVFVWSLLGVIVGIILFIKSKFGKKVFDSTFIKFPVVGEIIREINSARTARTMSSLLASGVSIVNAIEVTENVVPNHLYKIALSDAKNSIQKGETMSVVLSRYEKIYPSFIAEMTAVGEETGKISEMLMNVATFYETDIDDKTKNLSTIIEPVLMIVIGMGVAIFALSMLAPTYSLVNVI